MSKLLHGLGAPLASLLLAGLAACAPGRLPSGTYLQVHRGRVIALEGRTLSLADNLSFAYAFWSDDLSSSRYGVGTYQLVGRRLRLTFAASPPVAASAQVQALAIAPDGLELTFEVRGRSAARRVVALSYAVVTAYGKANNLLAGASTDAQGRAKLRLPRGTQPQLLRAECLGFITWNQACAVGSAAYQVVLPPNEGRPYAPGTTKEFRVRRASSKRLLLRQEAAQLAFERQRTGQ